MSEQGGKARRRLVRAAFRAEDSYILLFSLLLLDLFAAAFATSWQWILLLMWLVAATLLLALRTSCVGPKATRLAYVAVAAGVVFGVLAALQRSPMWFGWMFAAMAALLMVTNGVCRQANLPASRVTIADAVRCHLDLRHLRSALRFHIHGTQLHMGHSVLHARYDQGSGQLHLRELHNPHYRRVRRLHSCVLSGKDAGRNRGPHRPGVPRDSRRTARLALRT